jgi:hypothetical protein
VKLLRMRIGLTLVLVLIMGAWFPGLRPALAFEPIMDYWFIEKFTVEDAALPQGVTIHISDAAAQPRASLILENQTETPLFVMSLNYKDVLVMVTPDPNWKARVNGAHEVASYLVAPDRPASLNIEALTDLDRSLADRNVLTYDPPSANVIIPTAQSSELLLVYAGQVFEVPFKLEYALKTNFDNGSQVYLQWLSNVQATDNASATATQRAVASAARMVRNNILIVGLGGVAVLFVAGWLAWKGLSHHK